MKSQKSGFMNENRDDSTFDVAHLYWVQRKTLSSCSWQFGDGMQQRCDVSSARNFGNEVEVAWQAQLFRRFNCGVVGLFPGLMRVRRFILTIFLQIGDAWVASLALWFSTEEGPRRAFLSPQGTLETCDCISDPKGSGSGPQLLFVIMPNLDDPDDLRHGTDGRRTQTIEEAKFPIASFSLEDS